MPASRTRRDRRAALAPLTPKPAPVPAKASAGHAMFTQPRDIDGITALTGAGREVFDMIPAIRDIPDVYFGPTSGNPFVALQAAWQSRGIFDWELRPKPGIDEMAAIRHLMAVMRSIGLPDGYKAAAVSYMMSMWFEEPD